MAERISLVRQLKKPALCYGGLNPLTELKLGTLETFTTLLRDYGITTRLCSKPEKTRGGERRLQAGQVTLPGSQVTVTNMDHNPNPQGRRAEIVTFNFMALQ